MFVFCFLFIVITTFTLKATQIQAHRIEWSRRHVSKFLNQSYVDQGNKTIRIIRIQSNWTRVRGGTWITGLCSGSCFCERDIGLHLLTGTNFSALCLHFISMPLHGWITTSAQPRLIWLWISYYYRIPVISIKKKTIC